MPKQKGKKTTKGEPKNLPAKVAENSTPWKNIESKSLILKKSLFHATENFETQSLGFIEGFLAKGSIDKALNDMLEALALHQVKSRELYKEVGFNSFSEYCESKGISKSLGYDWAKHVETAGPENFPALAEKVGLNRTFFRAFGLIPQEMQSAVVKGEKIKYDGIEYDFSGDGESIKKTVKSIVDNSTTAIKNQNDVLQQQLDEFHKIIPASQKDVSKGEKQLMYAQAKYDEFEAALSALAFAEMEIDDIKIGSKIEGLLKTCHARLIHLAEKWDAHKRGDIQK